MEVHNVPPDATRLLVLLNGIKCYEQDHVPDERSARIPMREGFMESEMVAVLPGVRMQRVHCVAMRRAACETVGCRNVHTGCAGCPGHPVQPA